MQKALCLFAYIGIGLVLRPQFDIQSTRGIRLLIMRVLLPCVTFKGLVGITIDIDALIYPCIAAGLTAGLLVWGALVTAVVLPADKLGTDVPRRTAVFINATLAPGLSSFAFINEFGPPGAAGVASLMDIPVKFYQLALQGSLMRLVSPVESAAATPSHAGAETATLSLPRRLRAAVLSDNLNVAILAGLAMSAAGLGMADIGFVGTAVSAMATAQTPVLFVLIGLTIKLSGNAPLVACILLLLRAAASLVFVGTCNAALGLPHELALVTTLFAQAAVSMLGLGILSSVVDSQSKTRPAMNKAFAFDLVGCVTRRRPLF